MGLNVRDPRVWAKTGKKSYEIWVCKPPIGTKVYNELEDVHYTTSEAKPFVLSGTVGEQWVIDGAKLAKTYTFATGEPITADAVTRRSKHGLLDWVKVKTIPGQMCNFAVQLPKSDVTYKNFEVKTSWGEILCANRDGIKHGDGDYLVCSMTPDGMPNLNDVWVVNGRIFPATYNLQNFKVSEKARLSASKSPDMPATLLTKAESKESKVAKFIRDSLEETTKIVKESYHKVGLAAPMIKCEVVGEKTLRIGGNDVAKIEEKIKSRTVASAEERIMSALYHNEYRNKNTMDNIPAYAAILKVKVSCKVGDTVVDAHSLVMAYLVDFPDGARGGAGTVNTGADYAYRDAGAGWVYISPSSSYISTLYDCFNMAIGTEDLSRMAESSVSVTVRKEGLPDSVTVRLTKSSGNNTMKIDNNAGLGKLAEKTDLSKEMLKTGLNSTGVLVQVDDCGTKTESLLYMLNSSKVGLNDPDYYSGSSIYIVAGNIATSVLGNKTGNKIKVSLDIASMLNKGEEAKDGSISITKANGNLLLLGLAWEIAESILRERKTKGQLASSANSTAWDHVSSATQSAWNRMSEVGYVEHESHDIANSFRYGEDMAIMLADSLQLSSGRQLVIAVDNIQKCIEIAGKAELKSVAFTMLLAISVKYTRSIMKTFNLHGVRRITLDTRDEWAKVGLGAYTGKEFVLQDTFSTTYGCCDIDSNRKYVGLKTLSEHVSDRQFKETCETLYKIKLENTAAVDIQEAYKKLAEKVLETPVGEIIYAEFKKFMHSITHDESEFISKIATTKKDMKYRICEILGGMTNTEFKELDTGNIAIKDVGKQVHIGTIAVDDESVVLYLRETSREYKYLLDSPEKAMIAPYRVLIEMCKHTNSSPILTIIGRKLFWEKVANLVMSSIPHVTKLTLLDKQMIGDAHTRMAVKMAIYREDGTKQVVTVDCETDVKSLKSLADGTLKETGAKAYYNGIIKKIEGSVMECISFAYKVSADGVKVDAGLDWKKTYAFGDYFAHDLAEAISWIITNKIRNQA